MTEAQRTALARVAAHSGWVHAKRITEYRGVNVSTLRALVARGALESREAEGYPGFAVRAPRVAEQ